MADRPRTHADRDIRTDKHGRVVAPVFDETTDVVNPGAQAFRAVKALRDELTAKLDANERKAAAAHGALDRRVAGLELKVDDHGRTLDKIDGKLDRIGESTARLEGRVDERSRRNTGSGTLAVARWSFAGKVIVAIVTVLGSLLTAYLLGAHHG